MKMRNWVEISEGALRHNFNVLRADLPKKTRFMAVVKSNAYGHGIVPCARLYEKWGADFLGVDFLGEALEIRSGGVSMPILVLGYSPDENLRIASEKDISVTVSSLDQLFKIRNLDFKLKIHLKIDTGLHRQGIFPREVGKAIKIIKESESIKLEGLYSHLAGSEESRFDKFTEKQVRVFDKVYDRFKEAGFRPIKHISCTAAGLSFPDARFGMVRFGIGLYGLWPSEEARLSNSVINLKPALTWKSIVADIKDVKKGSGIGYDLTQFVRRDTKVVVIPVGYWHGYDRLLSGRARVLVNGKPCPVIGRVSMDMIVADVSRAGRVKREDEVLLLGSYKNEEISAEEIAEIAGTINYEIVTRINPTLERIFVK